MEFIEQSLKDLSYKYKFLEYFISNSNDKEEFTNCLVRIYNSKSEGEIKQASKDLVYIVEEKTGFCSDYYRPIIWTNSALESKRSLKHAELMMYREGYSSDEYNEHADDVFKFLEDISLKMLLHKKELNELDPEDNLWRAVYEEPSKFYGFILGAELWMEMMPQNAFRRLRVSYQEEGCKDATSVSLSSEIFNDLLILAIKRLKEIESSLDSNTNNLFEFFDFVKDKHIDFRDDVMGIVAPIKISKIYKNISNINLENLDDRLGLLRDLCRNKDIEKSLEETRAAHSSLSVPSSIRFDVNRLKENNVLDSSKQSSRLLNKKSLSSRAPIR